MVPCNLGVTGEPSLQGNLVINILQAFTVPPEGRGLLTSSCPCFRSVGKGGSQVRTMRRLSVLPPPSVTGG